jgi:hypothetical protein
MKIVNYTAGIVFSAIATAAVADEKVCVITTTNGTHIPMLVPQSFTTKTCESVGAQWGDSNWGVACIRKKMAGNYNEIDQWLVHDQDAPNMPSGNTCGWGAWPTN